MDRTTRAAELAEMRPRLLRRARRYTGCGAAAEDIVQEALLSVWLRLQNDAQIATLEAYLTASMRRLAARRRVRETSLEDAAEPRTAADAPRRIATAEVLAALADLPPEQANLIRGLAVDGESYAGLARRHNLPVGTVMSRIARGRARLKARFELPDETAVETLLDRAG